MPNAQGDECVNIPDPDFTTCMTALIPKVPVSCTTSEIKTEFGTCEECHHGKVPDKENLTCVDIPRPTCPHHQYIDPHNKCVDCPSGMVPDSSQDGCHSVSTPVTISMPTTCPSG